MSLWGWWDGNNSQMDWRSSPSLIHLGCDFEDPLPLPWRSRESDNRLLSVRHGTRDRATVKSRSTPLHCDQSASSWLRLYLRLPPEPKTQHDVTFGLSLAAYFASWWVSFILFLVFLNLFANRNKRKDRLVSLYFLEYIFIGFTHLNVSVLDVLIISFNIVINEKLNR